MCIRDREYINTLRDSRIIDNVPLVASDNKDELVVVDNA